MCAASPLRIGVIMNGVTGRMGANQHLRRSILSIGRDGGVEVPGVGRILPEPVLVGRDRVKLERLSRETGVEAWTDQLDRALEDPANQIYFDAQTTPLRAAAMERALEAGRHVYCEKPAASTSAEAYRLYRMAQGKGLKHGVVQDKLWVPGIVQLRRLLRNGCLGRILSVRGEFGYWVFDGREPPLQRPSWNYRKEEGGSIILDMFPHWRYLLENLFGGVRAVSCLGATHVRRRWNEEGREYAVTADDSAYATFLLEGGVVAHFNSSWAVRVRRDDLFTLQVDGTLGSAVCGLNQCWVQLARSTPRVTWNPDLEQSHTWLESWSPAPGPPPASGPFRAQWELFLRHVLADEPFPWNLLEGAKGVQLAECARESWRSRSWVDIPELQPNSG
jgi:predicted dehydrogenase